MPQHGEGPLPDFAPGQSRRRPGRDHLRARRRAHRRRLGTPCATGPRGCGLPRRHPAGDVQLMLRVLCLLAALVSVSTPALAAYPERPITITVGFAPGGTSDVAARIVAERLTRSLGVAVVVDNKPGAGGSIAAAATAAAAPDGYRIMLSDPGAFAINPIMQPQ